MNAWTALEPMRWWHIESAAALDADLFADAAWSAEVFWAELARPQTRSYTVALEGSSLIGYAGLMTVGAEADVQTVAVAPPVRGRGLGGVLVRHLLSQAAHAGARTVMLEVRRDNASALRLYRGNGFEQLAVRRGYYGPGEDAVIMRRVLT